MKKRNEENNELVEDELRYYDRNNHHHTQHQQAPPPPHPPQDLLANTRTRSCAPQPPFLPLQNASVCIEVSTVAGKVMDRDFRLPPRCK
jgi:hypothetical protein